MSREIRNVSRKAFCKEIQQTEKLEKRSNLSTLMAISTFASYPGALRSSRLISSLFKNTWKDLSSSWIENSISEFGSWCRIISSVMSSNKVTSGCHRWITAWKMTKIILLGTWRTTLSRNSHKITVTLLKAISYLFQKFPKSCNKKEWVLTNVWRRFTAISKWLYSQWVSSWIQTIVSSSFKFTDTISWLIKAGILGWLRLITTLALRSRRLYWNSTFLECWMMHLSWRWISCFGAVFRMESSL